MSILESNKKNRSKSIKQLDKELDRARRENELTKIQFENGKMKAGLNRMSTQFGGGGGYTGASSRPTALQNWPVSNLDPDADIIMDLDSLRQRGRDIFRNNGIGRGIIMTYVDNVVGSGLVMQSNIDRGFLGLSDEEADSKQNEIERKWRNWSESPECDIRRTKNFYEISNLAYLSARMSGESFATLHHVSRKGSKYKLKIQLHEADRCSSPNYVLSNTNLKDGIVVDDYGTPTGYWMETSPLYLYQNMDWELIPAFGGNLGLPNVLHLYKEERPGQTRGVPFHATIYENLKQLDRYDKAELTAAVVSAAFTGFIKSDRTDAADDVLGQRKDKQYWLEPGLIHILEPGEDIGSFDPKRPYTGFEAFVQSQLTIVGMATGIPYEVLVKRFNSSFTASKASRIEAWRSFMIEREWFTSRFCQPIFKQWLYEAVLNGEIDLPGFIEDEEIRDAYCQTIWVGDAQGQIDPIRETQAAIMKIDNGLSTLAKETAEIGGDFEKNYPRIKKEMEMKRAAGIGTAATQQQMILPFDDEDEDEQNAKNNSSK
jgi:lambda family phage portal protein